MPEITKKKASIVNLFFNYSNAIFTIVNGLFLLPLYLHFFSIGTYGSFLSSGNIIAMLGMLEGGASLVLTQKLAKSFVTKDFKEFSSIFGSGIVISIAIFFLILAVGLGFYSFISTIVKAEQNQYDNIRNAFLIAAIGAGLNITFNTFSSAFQAWLKVHISGSANLIGVILGLITTFLSLYSGLGVVSIALGGLIKGFTGNVIVLFYLRAIFRKYHYPKIRIIKKDVFVLAKEILPVFGGTVAKQLVTNSQLLIITNFVNPVAAAVFFITGRIYMVCDSFLAPIASSIFSSISQMAGAGDRMKLKQTLSNVYMVFTIFAMLILSVSFILNESFISLLVTNQSYGGVLLSAFLAINMFLYTRCNFLSVNLFALGVFGRTILVDVISSILRLVIIFLIINRIGVIAVPIAEILTTLVILYPILNKLMIGSLKLNRHDAFGFIFKGALGIAITFFSCWAWISYVPNSTKITSFVVYGLIFSSILSILLVLPNKDIRRFVSQSLGKF